MNRLFPLQLVVNRGTAHEDAFVCRYRTLLVHATRLTRGNRDLADDLLQDAFLCFSEAKPDLSQIDNLDAYLTSMVKYLHLGHVRRKMRDPLGEPSAFDCESAELSLSSASTSNLFAVYEQLIFICEFAFGRKDEVRAQALFLLRFVHGYYIDELAVLARNSKPTLRKWLHEAQSDVRAALESQPASRARKKSKWADSIQFNPRHKEFLDTLREHLLSFGGKGCPAQPELDRMYSNGQDGEVPTELLGHFAVCRPCLDSVNRRLGLPLLLERHLSELDGRGRRNGPGSGTGSSSGHFDLRGARRRERANIHHEPRKLLIRVDGVERAEGDLTLPDNRFALKLAAEERVHLVEVVSEQGVCLLSFFIPDAEAIAPIEMHHTLRMSGGRIASATLRYGETWPAIEVTYHTPGSSALPVASQSAVLTGSGRRPQLQGLLLRLQSWARSLSSQLASRMNPLLATATVLGIASILFFVLWWGNTFSVHPTALLAHAEAWEASTEARKSPAVIYQEVQIRSSGRTVQRSIYRDAQGKRRPRQQTADSETAQLEAKLALAGIDWNDPLSPTTYLKWREREPVRQERVSRSGKNLLTLTTSVNDGRIARESLTVRETDFHPVQRTVEFKDTGTIEIAELNYAVLPWGAVRDDWFEPLPGSVQSALPGQRLLPFHLSLPLTQNEIDTSELEARLVLAELKADTTERIAISPGASGVRIGGIVATDERKRAIESRLRSVPHVIVSIATFEEMQHRDLNKDGITGFQASTTVAELSPLSRYLQEKGRSADEAEELSQQLMNSGLLVKQHANALDELLRRFGRREDLTTPAQSDLRELIGRHRTALLAALAEEQQHIAQAGVAGGAEVSSFDAGGLMDFEKTNATLCTELTSGSDASADSARQMLSELASTVTRLHTVALSLTEERKTSTANTSTTTVHSRTDKQR